MIDKLKRSNSVGDIPAGQEPVVSKRERSQSSAGRIAGIPVTTTPTQEPPHVIEAIQNGQNTRANLIAQGPIPLVERQINYVMDQQHRLNI